MHSRAARWFAAGAVATSVTLAATALAVADVTPADNSAAPPAVEDFAHPGESPYGNVKLLRGDGHIMLTDCATAWQIRVLSLDVPNDKGNEICFRATSSTGYLAVEVPNTFLIATQGRPVNAKVTADGVSRTVDVPKNDTASIGMGSSSNRVPTTLLELRVTG
ncbi:hypothetical protein [Kitasatospora brasiliensis]|uniref:hypothetical protein n=1 Tax=Kitasatospora brasiliensis TaxID=3058040 RepID=UPI002931598F|nr:hypothetical protein [Kitasatospora sp. K002]